MFFTDNIYEKITFSDWLDTLSTSFVSFYFIAFVFLLILVYYLVPKRGQWIVLLVGSLLFYSIAGWEAVITVILTAIIVYCVGICIELTPKDHKKKRKLFLFAGLLSVLGMLIYVKVYGLLELDYGLVVPLGISYYTFSSIGYMADIYWGKEKAEYNYFKLLLFVIFFPKILQGPISRHKTLGSQLDAGYGFSYVRLCHGLQLAVWGYFKKLVIADRIAIFTSAVFADWENYGGAIYFVTVILAALQLYCDFSGCMDIAGGVAQCFGIELEKNFDHPFYSKSAAEFWRRWHITLGTWFKDYVYMQLAINPRLINLSKKLREKVSIRVGKAVMTIIPLLVVWIFTGLWHGTGVDYLVWGLYWGALIICSAIFAPELKKLSKLLHIDTKSKSWGYVQMLRTFLLFCIGRIITIPGDLAVTGHILVSFFTNIRPWQLFDGTLYNQGLDRQEFGILYVALFILWGAEYLQTKGSLRARIDGWNILARNVVYVMTIMVILIVGIYGAGYGNTTFAYMQF